MTRLSLQLPLLMAVLLAGVAHGQDKPNILIIWGDDIGPMNVSAYNMGIMGFETWKFRRRSTSQRAISQNCFWSGR